MSICRRTFVQTSLTTGILGALMKYGLTQEQVQKLTKNNIPTPALILDLDAFESNISKLAKYCKTANCGFRPHAKTHKCPEIAKRQIQSGAKGVCVATVREAECMVNAGIHGLLLTSPIMEINKISRIVDMLNSGGDIMLSLGDKRQVELLSQAADAKGVNVDVLVDVDVIDRRTGALPGKPALGLAQLVDKQKSLRLRGIQAYAGGASHTMGFRDRERVSREAMGKAVETQHLFKRAGLDTSILSGGSTGTYNIDSHIDGVTELQVGSYVFMDVGYMQIGSKNGDKLYTDFLPSLTVLTTVVSAAHSDLVTVDAGVKSMATSPPAMVKHHPGLTYRPFGDEFGAITSSSGTPLPSLEDRLEVIVPHCDPTVNLHGHLYAKRGEQVESVWSILGRHGASLTS